MKRPTLSSEALARALHLRDLTDPRQGPHAIQQITDAIHDTFGDHIRETIAPRLDEIEAVEVLSETLYDKLPAAAHERMGMGANQKNVLLRLEIRHPTRTLNREEANEIRDLVYRAVHRGNRKEICGQKAKSGWWL